MYLRRAGRRTGRRLQLSPQRAWATPLETLLLAERAALLTGRDEDFTMILTIGYTGLRWGEAIGLQRNYLRPGEIHVEWQLHELNGRFHRSRPRRTPTAARPGSRVSLSTCRLS
jgi:integrase